MHSGWRGEGTSQFCETDVIVAVAPKPHFWIRFHETNENLQLEEGRTDDLPTVKHFPLPALLSFQTVHSLQNERGLRVSSLIHPH